MSLQTIEQERAAAAWGNITEVRPQEHQGRYGALTKKFPTMVLTNGLGQTLAFLRSKGSKPQHRELYAHISAWVAKQVYGCDEGDDQLLERLMGVVAECESDSNTYRRATTEALAFAVWLKRFAEAELDIQEGED